MNRHTLPIVDATNEKPLETSIENFPTSASDYIHEVVLLTRHHHRLQVQHDDVAQRVRLTPPMSEPEQHVNHGLSLS